MFMLVSATTLSSYEYCPRKLFLNKVLKIDEPVKEVMVRGTVRHETYDLIAKHEENLVKSINSEHTFEELFLRYKQAHTELLRRAIIKHKKELLYFNLKPSEVFKETWPYVVNETLSRSKILKRFMDVHKVYGHDLWNTLDPKIGSEIAISSGALSLRGIIDRVEYYSDGSIVPYELKTGTAPKEGVWPGHKLQIAVYCMLLSEKHGKNIESGNIHYLDSDSIRPIFMNPFMGLTVNNLTKEVIDLLSSKEVPAYCQNKGKCSKCGIKSVCYDEGKIKELMGNCA